MAEPSDPTGPTEPTRATEPPGPAGAPEPPGPAASTGPAEPSAPTGPSEPTGGTVPTGPADSYGPPGPAELPGATDPAEPPGETDPTEPPGATDPAEPPGSTGPPGPTDPPGPTGPGSGTPAGPPGNPTGPTKQACANVEWALAEAGLGWENPRPGHYVVQLPGTRKLSTTASLVVGRHTLSLNAFVVRRPDESHETFYRWLLERNTRLYGVAYALDRLGDVYLVGRLPLAAVTPQEVDRLLGAVLEAADGSFNTLLELGFASAIRKEYQWRTARGESTRNLEAFSRLTREDPDA